MYTLHVIFCLSVFYMDIEFSRGEPVSFFITCS